MMQQFIMLAQVLFPVIAGCLVFTPFYRSLKSGKKLYLLGVLGATVVLSLLGALCKTDSVRLFEITPKLSLCLCNDGIAKLFCVLVSIIWVFVGIYSFRYLHKDDKTKNFYGFFLITLGVLQGVGMAGNLVSFYLFYEWMTLMTMPLVCYNGTKEAIRAARKYLFYSVTGASMVLFGIFLLSGNVTEFAFSGEVLSEYANKVQVYAAAVLLILGFGTKAGMFPMHGWLPTAHPVAPAPASAVLSGVITKAGVLGIIRSVYCVIGFEFLAGTFVQTLFLILSLLTVFMGSMLAYKEKILKKRLAYSTVSQVSYVLFGLALMTPAGLVAGIMHLVFHSVIKNALFLFAGTIIHESGEERVEEMKGLGRQMPVAYWCFTFAALALVGIPPTSGFVSKWYLAQGALSAPVGIFSYLGPAILLLSALLTAGYLLGITADGFFPGKDFVEREPGIHEKMNFMLFPLVILSLAAVVFGMCSGSLYEYLTDTVSVIFKL